MSLKSKTFIAYSIGLFFDRFGNALYRVVFPLILYKKTQSIEVLSLVLISQILPKVFLFFIVGPIVDGTDRKKTFYSALIIQSICCFVIGYLTQLDVSINYYYALSILISVAFEFSRNCEKTFVPLMFKNNINSANSILASIFSFCFIIAPLISLIDHSPRYYQYILYINSVSYIAPIIMSYWSKIPDYIPNNVVRNTTQIYNSFVDGLLYTLNDKTVFILLITSFLISLATSGFEPVIIFIIKNKLMLSDKLISYLFLFDGVGMFLASLLSMKVLSKSSKYKNILYTLLITIIITNLFLALENYKILIMAFTLVSFLLFFISLYLDIYLQNNIDKNYLGRVSSLFRITRQTGGSLSLYIAPLVFINAGQFIFFALSSLVISFALFLLFLFNRRLVMNQGKTLSPGGA